METLHPGLYMQEVPGENPIEGVSTSTGAFVGVTERGPIGKSGFVTSWTDFQKQYGGYLENSYLPYAVRGFFENGGKRAFISRVVHFANNSGTFVKTSAAATFEIKNTEVTPKVIAILDAYTDGTHGNDVEVEIIDGKDADTYTVTAYEDGQFVEKFENVPKDILEDTILSASTTFKITIVEDEEPIPVGKYKLAGGADGLTDLATADYVGDEALKTGLYAFDNDSINLVAIPGITDVGVIAGVVTYVEKRRDCSAVFEVPYGMKPLDTIKFANVDANIASARAFLYNTWLKISDPIGVGKNPTKFIPPSGHIMGVMARTDKDRGVWKAPAGLEAVIRGIIGIEYNVNDEEQDLLNPIGINAIRAFEGEGIVVWGARTRSSQSQWKYISTRRSVDFVAQSILNGTRWAVFEPNDPVLWGKITSVCEAFLRSYWRSGGLRGATEAEAFFAECNSNTTTNDDIDNGRLFANIGMADQKPAEFIIFRLSLLK